MFDFWRILLINVVIALISAFGLRGYYESRGEDKRKWSIIGGILGLFANVFGLIIILLIFARKPVHSRYPRTRGGPEDFEMVSHWGMFEIKLVEILYQGRSLGQVDLRKRDSVNPSLRMPDGTLVEVKLGHAPGSFKSKPYLSVDGKALPGSIVDPNEYVNNAGKAFLGGSGVSFISGLTWIGIHQTTASLYIGFGFFGLIIAVLLFLANRMGAVLGSIFVIINIATNLLMIPEGGFQFLDLIDDALFIYGLVQAYRGLSQLKEQK